jgi:hypothetical protein
VTLTTESLLFRIARFEPGTHQPYPVDGPSKLAQNPNQYLFLYRHRLRLHSNPHSPWTITLLIPDLSRISDIVPSHSFLRRFASLSLHLALGVQPLPYTSAFAFRFPQSTLSSQTLLDRQSSRSFAFHPTAPHLSSPHLTSPSIIILGFFISFLVFLSIDDQPLQYYSVLTPSPGARAV